jgi:hypothetical protein
VGLRAGLDWHRKSCHHQDSVPRPPSPEQFTTLCHPISQHCTQQELNSSYKDDVYFSVMFSVCVSCLATHSILLSLPVASQFCSVFSLSCEIFPTYLSHLYLSLSLGHFPFNFVFQNFEILSSFIFDSLYLTSIFYYLSFRV